MKLDEMFKLAGIDPTKGKAKKLCEQVDAPQGVPVWTDEGEQILYITDLPASTTTDELVAILRRYIKSEAVWDAIDDTPYEATVVDTVAYADEISRHHASGHISSTTIREYVSGLKSFR